VNQERREFVRLAEQEGVCFIMTSFEKLACVPEVTAFPRPNITLDTVCAVFSDFCRNRHAVEKPNSARGGGRRYNPVCEKYSYTTARPTRAARRLAQLAGKNR
jgi:hypothetical protein